MVYGSLFFLILSPFIVVTELCKSNLSEYINIHKKIDVQELMFFTHEILNGLQYLHDSCEIVHNDLNCSNIFLVESENPIQSFANTNLKKFLVKIGVIIIKIYFLCLYNVN